MSQGDPQEKLVKIDAAKVVRHGWCVIFQLAEVEAPRDLFRKILRLIDYLRPRPARRRPGKSTAQVKTTGGVCLGCEKSDRLAGEYRVKYCGFLQVLCYTRTNNLKTATLVAPVWAAGERTA